MARTRSAGALLPVEIEPGGAAVIASATASSPDITIVLRNGSHLRCCGQIEGAALARLVRILEAA